MLPAPAPVPRRRVQAPIALARATCRTVQAQSASSVLLLAALLLVVNEVAVGWSRGSRSGECLRADLDGMAERVGVVRQACRGAAFCASALMNLNRERCAGGPLGAGRSGDRELPIDRADRPRAAVGVGADEPRSRRSSWRPATRGSRRRCGTARGISTASTAKRMRRRGQAAREPAFHRGGDGLPRSGGAARRLARSVPRPARARSSTGSTTSIARPTRCGRRRSAATRPAIARPRSSRTAIARAATALAKTAQQLRDLPQEAEYLRRAIDAYQKAQKLYEQIPRFPASRSAPAA